MESGVQQTAEALIKVLVQAPKKVAVQAEMVGWINGPTADRLRALVKAQVEEKNAVCSYSLVL